MIDKGKKINQLSNKELTNLFITYTIIHYLKEILGEDKFDFLKKNNEIYDYVLIDLEFRKKFSKKKKKIKEVEKYINGGLNNYLHSLKNNLNLNIENPYEYTFLNMFKFQEVNIDEN